MIPPVIEDTYGVPFERISVIDFGPLPFETVHNPPGDSVDPPFFGGVRQPCADGISPLSLSLHGPSDTHERQRNNG